MRWTDRQRAMLEAMGLRIWLPPAADGRSPAAAGAAHSAPDLGSALADDAIAIAHATTARTAAPTTTPTPTALAPTTETAAALQSPSAGTAPMDWAGLRRTVAGCTACQLCESRRQTVFGVGHERAHWMIVGEAPGEQEDRQGEPFVGKSGQLLDNMLRAIGLTRADAGGGEGAEAGGDPARQVYICNTLKCRPPGNRNPEPEELARCETYLIRQIELVQPRIILAMGRFAVQSLLRSSEPIGRLRGRVHRYRAVPLIVTYHPAYLLRNGDDKARAWDDLCLAVETLKLADPAAASPAAARPSQPVSA